MKKYYPIIVTSVFIQNQYYMRDVLEFWIQLQSHPEIEILFKFIPKIKLSLKPTDAPFIYSNVKTD
jgi:hypothetical protein